MTFAYTSNNGFWVATAAEVADYLGYPQGHFGEGFIAGRWLGAATQLGVFVSLAEAIASEPSVTEL